MSTKYTVQNSLRQVRDSNPCTLARSRFRDGRRSTWLTWQEILEVPHNKANQKQFLKIIYAESISNNSF